MDVQAQLLAEVQKLNDDPAVHGILVQLPLPKHIEEPEILKAIKVAASCLLSDSQRQSSRGCLTG